jgi:peptidoglycan/LPS O-acetylase OafA/YrhL
MLFGGSSATFYIRRIVRSCPLVVVVVRVLGMVSSVGVDSNDHIWVLRRPRAVRPEENRKAVLTVPEFEGR